MLLFAVTTLEKVQNVPNHVWLTIGLGVLIFIVALMVLRAVAQMNKIILCILVCVVLSVVGFSWVYNRNEPTFLSPVIDRIAPFFPSGPDASKNVKKQDRILGR
jgi:amino acid transporter